jgi:rsbT co-antagonist protein RsbR
MSTPEATTQITQAELTRLHQRIAELEREVALVHALEDDLHTLFESISDALFVHALDDIGTILDVNEAMLQLYGVDRNTATTYTVQDYSSPNNDQDAIADVLRRALDGEVPTFEWRARRPVDGSEFDVEVTLRRIVFKQQPCILATVQEISQRKHSEARLRTSEERFHAIFERSSLGIEVGNRDGLIFDSNPAFQKLLGYTHEEISHMRFADFSHPDDREASILAYEKMMQGDQNNYLIKKRYMHKDGHPIWVQVAVSVIRDDAGEPLYALGVVHDISAQQEAEENLSTFKTLVENAPDSIVVSTPENIVTYANAAFRELTGYDNKDLGRNVYDFYAHPPDELREVTDQVLSQGFWQGELTYRRKDGSTFPGQLSVFAVLDSDGQIKALARIIRDLTTQKQAEAERAMLHEQIIDAQQAALRELSTPLIPVSDKVVIMPLIGTIDTGRAQQVMETLLEGVAHHQATLAILDITGVSIVDTQVAQALIGAAQAVRLLGAQVMLTGIQPQIAQTLVHLGVDLSNIETRGSLQSGIADALRKMKH